MKLYNYLFDWIKRGKCPSCDSVIEFINTDGCGILVNNESRGRVEIPNFWVMSKPCKNPNCEWSKIKDEVDVHNLCSVKEAWRFYKK
jgi:hypothetical protein